MTKAAEVLCTAIPFVWLGLVLGVSWLEAPLKFRAPGITLALGLGIGRLVFRALNIAELALLAVLTLAMAGSSPGAPRWVLVDGLWVVLIVQTVGLRPPMDRRAQQIIGGGDPPKSSLHLVYVGLEVVKTLALPVLGVLQAVGRA